MTNDLLETLKTAGAPMTRLELATARECSRPTIDKRVKPLVESGLVQRVETRDEHNRKLIKFTLPQPDNPLQIRHLKTGGYSMRCPDCGKRHRMRRVYDRYVLHCRAADSWRMFIEKELI